MTVPVPTEIDRSIYPAQAGERIKMIHSVLMIGQSNMAGRGFLSDAEPIDTRGGRLKVLRNGRWQTMYRPINPDRPFSGTSLAESFAGAYADDHSGIDVGVIPAPTEERRSINGKREACFLITRSTAQSLLCAPRILWLSSGIRARRIANRISIPCILKR